MVYPCKEFRRRLVVCECPLQTFIYPDFDCGSIDNGPCWKWAGSEGPRAREARIFWPPQDKPTWHGRGNQTPGPRMRRAAWTLGQLTGPMCRRHHLAICLHLIWVGLYLQSQILSCCVRLLGSSLLMQDTLEYRTYFEWMMCISGGAEFAPSHLHTCDDMFRRYKYIL